MKSSNVKSISLKIKRFGDCLKVSYFCSLLNSSTCCLTKIKKKLNVKTQKMKKKLILALAVSAFGIASSVFAQPPLPPTFSGGDTDQVKSPGNPSTPSAPLAPATLLLLGLAGSFAGVKIYQNNKKEE